MRFCALRGEIASAKHKRQDRLGALRSAGIMLPHGVGIDTVDAALCALTAIYVAANTIKLYGDAESGLIIIPRALLPV